MIREGNFVVPVQISSFNESYVMNEGCLVWRPLRDVSRLLTDSPTFIAFIEETRQTRGLRGVFRLKKDLLATSPPEA